MFKKGMLRTLICFTLIPVIAVIAALAWYSINYMRNSVYELELQMLTQTADATKRALSGYLAELEKSLAHQVLVAQEHYSDPKKLGSAFTEYMSANTSVWALYLFDLKGKIVAGGNAKESLAGADRSDATYVKAILGGSDSYMDPSLRASRSGGDPTFAFARAVRDANGKLLGGVAIFPKWLEFTATYLDHWRFGKQGYGYILDKSGVLIGHAMNKDLLMKDIGNESFVKEAMRIKDGVVKYVWKGEDKVLVSSFEPKSGWYVCMSASVSELTESAGALRNVLIGLGAGAVLALIAIIAMLLRRLATAPLGEVEAFTKKIASGDFNAKLPEHFKYEMADLASNIRHMVGELKNKLGFSQGILNGMTFNCIVSDPEEKIVHVNPSFLKFMEYPGEPKDYVGWSVSRFFYHDESKKTVIGRAMLEKKPICNIQAEITTHRQNSAFGQIDAAPLFDLDGKLIGGMVICADLTALKKQQAQIEAQAANIARAASEANGVADQVASASQQLAAQINHSSQGSEEQRMRTTEMATAIDEMNATVREVAQNASSAAFSADQAKARAQSGAAMVEAVVKTINGVNELAEALKADMAELGAKAEGIGRIMNVISDIADQTNLLALNAAIEAARAGEAGRGFAVVADEVRKLAEKTMSATNEVGDFIRSMQDSVRKNMAQTDETTQAIEKGAEQANASGQELQQIVSLVEQTADQVRSIATASEEQSAASEEINRATGIVNSIAAQTAEGMAESAKAVEALAKLGQELRRIMATVN
jgi:methyl-accepting chemotaxis protein